MLSIDQCAQWHVKREDNNTPLKEAHTSPIEELTSSNCLNLNGSNSYPRPNQGMFNRSITVKYILISFN